MKFRTTKGKRYFAVIAATFSILFCSGYLTFSADSKKSAQSIENLPDGITILNEVKPSEYGGLYYW
jgi:hypothetical protein